MKSTIIVFRKELKELVRDYRTVLASIGVPLILFPLLAMILSYGGQSGGIGTPTDVRVFVSGQEGSDISRFLRTRDELNLVAIPHGATVQQAVVDGSIDVAVVLPDSADVSVIFDNTNHRSSAGAELVLELLAALQTSYGRSAADGVTSESPQFALQVEPVHPVAAGAGTLILSFLLPVLILISAAIGPLASAADLGAGEKERRTLESLLGSPARRSEILAGKFAAVVVMGVLGVLAFFAGTGLAYFATRSMIEDVQIILTGRMLLSVGYIAILAALTFSAVEFLISLYARSSKAAQTFCVPVLILASAAGYATLMVDLRSQSLWYYHVPVLNLGLIAKGAALDILQPVALGIVTLWVVVYSFGAFTLGRWLINRESVFRSV